MFCGLGRPHARDVDDGVQPDLSYHNGSVWPHDNAICAAGLMRYGFVDEAHRVMRGHRRSRRRGSATGSRSCSRAFTAEEVGFPVRYPTSCSPQAWAAASPLLFLRTMLRFEPDIRNARLHLAPVVPDWIGRLSLERIPLMGGRLTIDVDDGACRVRDVPDGLTVVGEPRQPQRTWT